MLLNPMPAQQQQPQIPNGLNGGGGMGFDGGMRAPSQQGMKGMQPQQSQQGMKGMGQSQQPMKGMQQGGQGGAPQGPTMPGGIMQAYPSQTPGMFTGQGQGFQGMGQGFQGMQGMQSPGSSFANPQNPSLGNGAPQMQRMGQASYLFNPASMGKM